jgi:hypothetical protein
MRSLRTSTFCVAILLLPFTGRCQQPFPTYGDGGTWSVLHCVTGIGTTCHTETYGYIGSDTFCGHIWSTYVWPSFGDPNIAYLRNDGQRTLLRRTSDCLHKEYVIYDFSMDVGDSVYSPMTMDIMDPDTTLFILQAIDTVEILGVERRRFSLLFDPCNENFVTTPMEWIEGIGSTMHPFYPVDCLCDFCEQSLTLLCYDSSEVQLYVDPVFQTCDTLITAIDERGGAHASMLSVFHDATAGSLYVTVNKNAWNESRTGLALVLMASDGRIVRQQGLTASAASGVRMDVASVAPGVYVLLLTNGSERLAAQRVIIQ